MNRYDYGKKLWNELWKRAKDGYYKDKPYQFSKDELYIRYLLGLIDEGRYIIEKAELEQLSYDYYWREKDRSRGKKYSHYPIVL